jgi:hypothetical protein
LVDSVTRRWLASRLLGSTVLASIAPVHGGALARLLAGNQSSRFSPPGEQIHVSNAMTTAAIQQAINSAGSGNTVIFGGSGTYNLDSNLILRSHTYFYAPDGCTIQGGGPGGLVFNGDRLSYFTANGFTFASQGVTAQRSTGCTVGNCTFHGDPPNSDRIHVEFSGSVNFTAINNDHRNGTGNIYNAWDPTRSLLSGNAFTACNQGYNICFNAPPSTAARDITIELNKFIGIGRMAIEFGGDQNGDPANTRIIGNWADDFAANEQRVAYSIVRGLNTTISGNFARLGPINAGKTSIGIELSGSGVVIDNDIRDFAWGVIFYSPVSTVTNNQISGWIYNQVLDYRNSGAGISGNSDDRNAPIPPQPTRREWLG